MLSLLYGPTLTFVHDYWKNHSFDYTHLCRQSDVSGIYTLSRFVIAFLPRSKGLLISWLTFGIGRQVMSMYGVLSYVIGRGVCYDQYVLLAKLC